MYTFGTIYRHEKFDRSHTNVNNTYVARISHLPEYALRSKVSTGSLSNNPAYEAYASMLIESRLVKENIV